LPGVNPRVRGAEGVLPPNPSTNPAGAEGGLGMRAGIRSMVIGLGLSACLLAGPGAFAASVSGPVGGSFAQGARSPSISGGLWVGGRIDGLPIVRVIHLTATAYGPTAQDNYPYGATDAFGAPLRPGDVAVDPRVIKLNTQMYVTGYRTSMLPAGGELAVARDTGGAIKGNRIDMYVSTHNESQINAFGIQHVTAYILG
jgi:3D (Asp-Asp-Asp) domain-containing protein